jgi:hypothetical protein
MYGLPQAIILANKLLQQRLGRHSYFEVQHTPGLWKHISHPIWFNLCVNNFGVKYISNENLKYLVAALSTETYEVVKDWVSDLYCGINLEWIYVKRWVDIAMHVYAIKNLTRYNHHLPLKPQHCPYTLNPITYGKDNQATTPSNTSSLLLMLLAKSAHNKLVVVSYTTHVQSTQPFLWHYLLSPYNKVPQLKKPSCV